MQTRAAATAALVLIPVLALAGCAGRAWRQAEAEDTVAAYHRFLREHGDSSYSERARTRLDFVRVRTKPSRKAFEGFSRKHAGDPLVEELRPFVAEHFFRGARAAGTAAAYRAFLSDFPDGSLAARAEGNAVYLEARGFAGDSTELAEFAERHPTSDFAAEAGRSASAIAARGSSSFDRIGLVLDVSSPDGGADRLRRLFTERAVLAYRTVGVDLIPLSGRDDPRGSALKAHLTIAHTEESVSTKLGADGEVSEPGVLARTTITLTRSGVERPIWERHFEHRASNSERRAGRSILFGAGTQGYWDSFFVPVATWDTRRAARDARDFPEPPAAVEVAGSRAVVVFETGDFQLFDLSDPASPALLADYRRERDLARFEGARMLGSSVAVFGEDGIEIVALGPEGPARSVALGRDVVGSVVAVERVGAGLVSAGNRGLLWIGEGPDVRVLLDRPLLGLARQGERLLFTDGGSLFVTTLAVLQTGRVEGELRLGRGFGPGRVRSVGAYAVVIGDRGTLWVDVRNPSRPRVASRIEAKESGAVADATVLGGRLFLLGTRGLQVTDRSGERLVESVDVRARRRLGASGRHLVMIGEDSLQVVDATALVNSPAAAARSR